MFSISHYTVIRRTTQASFNKLRRKIFDPGVCISLHENIKALSMGKLENQTEIFEGQ